MMKTADYKCFACTKKTELIIENNKNFPPFIKCSQCQNDAKRIFTSLFPIIHQGKVGNSKNGYKSNFGKVKKT